MKFNLLTNTCIPIRRRNGSREKIAAHDITDQIDTNPVVAFDAIRPDFNASLTEMFIGWLQIALMPKKSRHWHKLLFEAPPTPNELQNKLQPLAPAFELHTETGGFLQDQDALAEQKSLPITALLIDTVGSETHWNKDLPTQGVSPFIAALMLYTLQNNAPSGGVGHRTSLRGGGPLSTLVLCSPQDENAPLPPLWQTLWLNVLDAAKFAKENEDFPSLEQKLIFPWLTATRTSEKKGAITTPEQVSPLQQFWGMPRRIRLDFENLESGVCALSGEQCEQLIRQYRAKNYGTNYEGAWQHTLSPHTIEAKQVLALHPNGAMNYRHWFGWIKTPKGDEKKFTQPAAVVTAFKTRDIEQRHKMHFRLWAYGYDMDNMKPRCWYEATMPLFYFDSEKDYAKVENAAEQMIIAAGEFLNNLRSCLKAAWFSEGDPRKKGANTAFIDAAFWHDTEKTFYDILFAIADQPQNTDFRDKQFKIWHTTLFQYTVKTFDIWANSNQIGDQTHPKRIAQARKSLHKFNWKKVIKDALELPDTKNKAA